MIVDVTVPQLLVSVRSVAEARIAIECGVDIIDIKEPAHGSLGCAAAETISSILELARSAGRSAPRLSVALGELTEWSDRSRGEIGNRVQRAVSGGAPDFAKVGLAGAARSAFTSGAWQAELSQLQRSLTGPAAWVAVAYADHSRAEAPALDEVLGFAADSGCRVLLLDTFQKDSTTLCDWLSLTDARRLRAASQRAGMLLAFAGRIDLRTLGWLREVGPDIVAVRGAVCSHGDRGQTICPVRLREFQQQLLAQRFAAASVATT